MRGRWAARGFVIAGFILLVPAFVFLSLSRTNPSMRRVGYVFIGAGFTSYAIGRIVYFGLLYKERVGKRKDESKK